MVTALTITVVQVKTYVIDENNRDNYPLMKPRGMPPGMSADLIRRKAWPEHHHFVLSKDGEPSVYDRHETPGYQTLYGVIENIGNVTIPAGAYNIVWNVSSTVSTRIVETIGSVDLAPGEIAVLAYDVPAEDLDPGRYYVETRCYYYYAMEGEKTKNFRFAVVP
jgi:hypothetical protein